MYEYDTYRTASCPLKIKKVKELPDVKIDKPEVISTYMRKHFSLDEKTEEFLYLICLNTAGKEEGIFLVSRGTVNMSCTSPAEIIKRALLLNSSCYIILHNHPSGETKPSSCDIDVANKLSRLSKDMGLTLTDSIIVGGDTYFSFKEKELI